MADNSSDFCQDCAERLSDVCRQCSRENGEDNWIVGYQHGAAVACGLMGMAEAIRTRPVHATKAAWVEPKCIICLQAWSDCYGSRCGGRRHRHAGEPEWSLEEDERKF